MRRFLLSCLIAIAAVTPAKAATLTILGLGDSLMAGYGLEGQNSYPAQLEAALRAKGHDVRIINGGVSGDTAAQGAARLDWVLGEEVDGVIVELGANDALRGLPPVQMGEALGEILKKLKAKGVPALLMGMRAPPNMGPDYARQFDALYPALAEEFGALLYPFFLDGVAAEARLNQADGIHPNADGVAVLVKRTAPMVEELLKQAEN